MEYPQDWVITALGKVVRRDKAKANDVIDEAYTFDNVIYPNSFPEKEDAVACRDHITDICPNAFLPKDEPKRKPGPKSKAKAVEQDEFRELMRAELMERQEQFWTAWGRLRPEDKCAIYAKLLLFAYSKAPSERVVDPAEALKRKAEAKRQEVAARIDQGLNSVADTDFEE